MITFKKSLRTGKGYAFLFQDVPYQWILEIFVLQIWFKELLNMRVNLLLFSSLLLSITMMVGCNSSQPSNEVSQASQDWKTTRLHIDGFMKAKSGAIWMSWPERVKQALEELAAVSKIEMLLERDEFVVTYDPTKATDELLIETVKQSGFTARVVTDQNNKPERLEKPTGSVTKSKPER